MKDTIQTLLQKKLPVFGVCLGHQGLSEFFGGELAQLPKPYHGKPTLIRHNSHPMFEGISREFEVGRYHSIYVRKETLPDCLESLAESIPSDGESRDGESRDGESRDEESRDGESPVIMAMRHRTLPILGVQFHPESIMTLKKNVGHHLLCNMIDLLTHD